MRVGVAAVVVFVGAARAEAACPPIALLYGEPALVESGTSLLIARGVAVSNQDNCAAVIAVMARDLDGERVRVTITDVDGRSVERVVDDVDGAATAIETWARRDVTAPLLAARDLPANGTTTPFQRDGAPPVGPPDPGAPRYAITAAPELGGSSDGALWWGGRGQVAFPIGRGVRVGGIIRLAADTERRGASLDRDTSRIAFALMGLVDRPIAVAGGGRFVITPGAGLGQLTMRATREAGEAANESATVLHVQGQVAARYRIAGTLAIGLELAVGYSPVAPRLLDDPPEDPDDLEQLAGVPALHGWLGIGLTYGAP